MAARHKAVVIMATWDGFLLGYFAGNQQGCICFEPAPTAPQVIRYESISAARSDLLAIARTAIDTPKIMISYAYT